MAKVRQTSVALSIIMMLFSNAFAQEQDISSQQKLTPEQVWAELVAYGASKKELRSILVLPHSHREYNQWAAAELLKMGFVLDSEDWLSLFLTDIQVDKEYILKQFLISNPSDYQLFRALVYGDPVYRSKLVPELKKRNLDTEILAWVIRSLKPVPEDYQYLTELWEKFLISNPSAHDFWLLVREETDQKIRSAAIKKVMESYWLLDTGALDSILRTEFFNDKQKVLIAAEMINRILAEEDVSWLDILGTLQTHASEPYSSLATGMLERINKWNEIMALMAR